jgi:ABC-type sugar transport system ATPase subunit
MIAGLEQVSRGEIRLDDQPITDWAPHERGMAMVFQNYALYPHMNVYGNIAFALRLARRPKDEIDRRVRRVAAALELEPLLERRISQLSGGQQQRVALARAMVKEPKVFLFDEPLSNLDAALRTRMRVEIKRLHLQLKTTSIFVTHDQEEAMILSDYIAVMRDGMVVQYGPAEEVYRRPQHHYVATFIGKPRMGTIEGRLRVTTDGLAFSAGELRLAWPRDAADGPPQDVPAILGIRAEDVRMHAPGATVTGAFAGQVELLEPLGSDTFVEVGRGGLALTVRIEPDRRVAIGEAVTLELPRHKLHFFHGETQQRLEV